MPGAAAHLRPAAQGWRERYLSLLGASGCTVQLYLRPGAGETQGRFYREPHGGRLAVVLGAGGRPALSQLGCTCAC